MLNYYCFSYGTQPSSSSYGFSGISSANTQGTQPNTFNKLTNQSKSDTEKDRINQQKINDIRANNISNNINKQQAALDKLKYNASEEQPLSEVKAKWHPSEGLFTKDGKTIANEIIKNSRDKNQAVKRITFYMNRAGKGLKNKHEILYAKDIIQNTEFNVLRDAWNSVKNTIGTLGQELRHPIQTYRKDAAIYRQNTQNQAPTVPTSVVNSSSPQQTIQPTNSPQQTPSAVQTISQQPITVPKIPEYKLATVPGYEDDYWNQYDKQIIDKAYQYNNKYGYKPGDAQYMDPNLVKAWMMAESGGSKDAFKSDPFQVNNTGDWDDAKKNLGLQKGVAPGFNGINAAFQWKRDKGMKWNKGSPTWTGHWWSLYNYNGNKRKDANGQEHRMNYANRIWNNYKKMGEYNWDEYNAYQDYLNKKQVASMQAPAGLI